MKTIPANIQAGILDGSLAVVPVEPSAGMAWNGLRALDASDRRPMPSRDSLSPPQEAYRAMLAARPDHLKPGAWPEADPDLTETLEKMRGDLAEGLRLIRGADPRGGVEWERSLRAVEAVLAGMPSAPMPADPTAPAKGADPSKAPATETGWQPIETAPRDGSEIWTYGPDGVMSGYFSESSYWHGQWMHWESRSDGVPLDPTHWQPKKPVREPAPPPAEAAPCST